MRASHPGRRQGLAPLGGASAVAASATAADPLLSVRGLSVFFRAGYAEVQATGGVSFDVQPGERLGIVGESGCGKTVTGLALLGLLPRATSRVAGSAMFEGQGLISLAPPPTPPGARPPDRHDLSGADECARPSVHHRLANWRNDPHPFRR